MKLDRQPAIGARRSLPAEPESTQPLKRAAARSIRIAYRA